MLRALIFNGQDYFYKPAWLLHSRVTNDSVGKKVYCQTPNISSILAGNKTVDHSDVVGASPVGSAPTTSSFSS